jgi:hypothetical protein
MCLRANTRRCFLFRQINRLKEVDFPLIQRTGELTVWYQLSQNCTKAYKRDCIHLETL